MRQRIANELKGIGEPALEALSQALDDADAGVRRVMVYVLGDIGEPALEALTRALDDANVDVRRAAVYALGKIGEPALAALTHALDDADADMRKEAVDELGDIGEPALEALTRVLDDADADVRRQAVDKLGDIGEPALEALTRVLDDADADVRKQAVDKLGDIGEPALEALTRALDDADADVRRQAVYELGNIGEPALEALGHALEDEDEDVRLAAITVLTMIGESAVHLLAVALEDPEGSNSERVVQYLSGQAGYVFFEPCDIEAHDVAEAIIDELIIRSSGRSSEYFNCQVVTEALQGTIHRNPRLRGQIQMELCNLAYQHDGGVRERAVAVARGLGADEFASLIKARAEENPTAAAAIMRMLGGSEAAAFFSESQSQALERFRAPLVELEEVSRQRWNELTRQARSSFYISMAMSVGLFLVRTTIVIWGIVLLTRSSELSQQIGGGLLSALAALATTFSGRFWKDPVEHIQKFSAQQARLQAAFIGYVNRVAQLRLVFEHDYVTGEIALDELEAYQRMLSEAVTQASQQLTDH